MEGPVRAPGHAGAGRHPHHVGQVTGKQEKGGMGLIDLEIGMKTQDGIESMPGTATVVLPLKDGPPIPYPFVPPAD